MTTGKTIALTGWTFVGEVMSLLLSRLLITFLPRSKHSRIEDHKYGVKPEGGTDKKPHEGKITVKPG